MVGKTRMRLGRFVFVAAWLGLGLGLAEAQVAQLGQIAPIGADLRPVLNPTVTLSILRNGVDVTATWLPTPGDVVTIQVNGLPNATVQLRCPDGALGTACGPFTGTVQLNVNQFLNAAGGPVTSAYPGTCTNTGNGQASDFTLNGMQLTSHDCGGMAVVVVGTNTFIVPQDSNLNGIPDVFEAGVTGVGVLNAGDDIDQGPVASSGSTVVPTGDGIANFDEYRGFMVNGIHTRLDPRQKDLFLGLVNPQCGTSSLIAGVGGAAPPYPTAAAGGAAALFTNLDALIAGSPQIHILGYTPGGSHLRTTEWTDHFFQYNTTSGVLFRTNPDGPASSTDPPRKSAPSGDRQINKNAVYPNGVVQRGIRIIECAEADSANLNQVTMGVAAVGTPNALNANAIVYTQRIKKYFTTLITSGENRRLELYRFINGAWQLEYFNNGGPPSEDDKNFVISRALQFYMAHEPGHAVKLHPIKDAVAGNHHPPDSGSLLDQAPLHRVEGSNDASGRSIFHIPAIYNTFDQSNFLLK